MTPALLLGLLLPLQLRSARVEVALRSGASRVEATYAVAGGAGGGGESPAAGAASLVLEAIRLPGRRLVWEGVDPRGGPVALDTLPGLYRLRVRLGPAGPSGAVVRLRYRIEGPLDRIPLFVPTVPAEAGAGAVRIRISGADPDLPGGSAFPRLEPEGEGVFRARLDNVPAFVVLPRAGTPFTVTRVADGVVLLLVLGGTGAWLLWGRGWAGRRRREVPSPGSGG